VKSQKYEMQEVPEIEIQFKLTLRTPGPLLKNTWEKLGRRVEGTSI
jgi:hypothetical protein